MAKRPVPKYDFKAFGAAIKAARTGRKESRKKVSDEMFISPRYLANIENKGQHPSLQIFFELTTERAILNWIASNRAWNYLFGLLRHYYRTGHHDDNYIFPEFKIGSAYVADYLLIGNSSDGYQFVFVELEAPNGRITKEKGTRFGEVINKGIEQVRDWQMYIAANWNVIVAELEKHSFSNTKLPRQLYKYCPYQIYYAVIAGLRKDFENIRDRKLQLQNENNITLLHYENLIDVANEN